MFEAAGARDKVDFFEYDDTHGWSKPRREATYRWFEKWLNGRDDEGIEPEIEVEPAPTLNVTATGQLATSGGTETVSSLNAKLAAKLHASRRATKGEAVAGLVRARLSLATNPPVPEVRKLGEVGRDGYRIEKLLLEAGVPIPALAFVPAAGANPKPAILYIHSGGKQADAGRGGDIESLVRAGNIVLAADPRGWGETAAAGNRGGYNNSYQTYMRGFLVGRYMPGLLVSDALAALAYLRSRPGVDVSRIGVMGKGNGGVVALYTALLDGGVAKVAAERAPTSYLAIAQAKQHEGVLDIVVPGVLGDFDLPDVVRAISPRPVWLVDPRTPTGTASDAREYEPGGTFRVSQRPEGWSFIKVYGDWLSL